MGILAAETVRLWVGDGATAELFTPLTGTEIRRLELTNTLVDTQAVRADSWAVGMATAERRAVVECNALATESAAAIRLRLLAMQGIAGNFRLQVSASERFDFTAFVVIYREIAQAGALKKIQIQLQSSGPIALVGG